MSGSNAGEISQSLFEHAPISLWEEDYSDVKLFFDRLRAEGIMDFGGYLDEHPEELENSIRRIKIRHVNRETLSMFGAASEEEMLANLGRLFREETRILFHSGFIALWNGEGSGSGDGIGYRLSGEAIHLQMHWRILPECLSNWKCVLVSVEDITVQKQIEKRYQLLFEHAPISLWEEDYSTLKTEFDNLRARGVTDLQSYLSAHPEALDRFIGLIRVLNVNRRTLQLFEADDREMLLANLNRIFRNDRKEHFVSELVNLWNGKTSYDRDGVNYSLSGEPINVHRHWMLMPGYENNFGWVLVTLQDVTAHKRTEDYLRYLGTHDVMTGLFNRAYFEETLQKLELDCVDPISFIIVDLNELKNANDLFGHHTGDQLIRRAARVLQACIEQEYTLARVGGDEFTIIMPGGDAEAARVIIERVQALTTVNNKYYGEPALSLSLGAATRTDGLSLEKVISLADDAMYRDKGIYHGRRMGDQRNRP